METLIFQLDRALVQPGGEKYPFSQEVCPLHRGRNFRQSKGVVISARLY
jgi:hypothetical protein